MSARRPPVLLGRARERELLDRMLDNVRGGQSAVLVIRGEAGAGKTALLHYCARQAAGFRVARVAGVESEMELPFAGLHQLCGPLLGRLDALPEPQQAALRVALGLSAGATPDRFLVALAALTLLAEVAAERPLLCFVDDAQWLDAASGQVLGFVARRLLAESVAIVFAVRDPAGEPELAGLPELALGGLPDDEARALLATVIPGRLDERVRDRLVAETRGNPLAILELPRGLAPTQLPGGLALHDDHTLPGRIEERFQRQLESLPREARLVLLVAAAEPVDDPLLLWRAAERLGVGLSAEPAAETEGLLAVGERVTFLHPLVRSAVYRSASPQERRAVHLALAESTDGEADADRRAWHLAAAAPGPDEAVAAELQRSADRAQARGGLAAAAAFLRRSVALTRDPARRVDRALAAAQASLYAGAFEAALGLLAAAESRELSDLQDARADLLHAELAYAQNRGSDAPPLLLRAARKLEALDVRLARETYLDAWSSALFAGHLAHAGNLRDVSDAVATAPAPEGAPRPSDLLLDGFALAFTAGRPAAVPVLRRACAAFAGDEVSAEEILRWGWLATAAAAYVWDLEGCLTLAGRNVQLAREAGALEVLAVAANVCAQAATLAGDFAGAAQLVAEADAVVHATGTRVAPYGALVLAGHRGRAAEAFELIHGTIESATAGGQGTAVQYAQWAKAVAANGLGRYPEALAAATAAADDTPELFVSMWALSELVEAAARTGRADVAALAVARLGEHTRDGTEWALGIEARSRALVSEPDAADGLYREAIGRLERTPLRPQLARTHLLYGEWLRREGRRIDAREQLRAANARLVSLGMEAFAERARRELLATGEKVRKRTVETRDELTAQERQIAQLARDGLTNPEIGARLFLSPRTVEWHLKKVFTKLGISSRTSLHDALPRADRETATA
jgi:DNA-binding CsgD family transcriptional regulator